MNRSLLVTLLVFSLAVNVATAGSLLFFWAKAQASPVEIAMGQKPMKKFLKDDLGLAPDKLTEIMELIDEERPAIVELKRKFDLTRTEMQDAILADPVDVNTVKQRVREINRIHGRIREKTIGTVMKITQSLPPGARDKFAQYLRSCKPPSGVCAPGRGRGPYGDVQPGG